jgi:suppressor of ftsI
VLSRRELLIGGTAGAASLAALSATGCGGPIITSLVQGPNTYNLPVQFATLPIGGVTVRTRTYGGTIPGPTLVAAPGQPLTITVNNQLPPNPSATPAPGIDPLDNPHAFNSTNLHVHGMQVVPHIFDPIGTSNPSASIIAIAPGASLQYPFVLPSDHPSGLFWYHPHAHGSTDTQVSGGMAGLIIVKGPIDQVPEIAAARDIPIAVQTLNLNRDPSTGMYTDEYLAYQPPATPPGPTGGYTPRSTDLFVLVNGQLVSHGSGFIATQATSASWTASAPPQIQMAPGEVVRLRILNGANSLLLPLQLPSFAVYVIAVDGVNLLAPYLVPAPGNIPLAPGNRVELLVQAPLTPLSNTLTALATGNLPGTDKSTHSWPAFSLMQFVVSGQPVSMSIPASLPTPTREYPLLASNPGGQRNVTLNDAGSGSTILSGTDLTVNNLLYNEANVLFNLPVGTADTWTVTNGMATEGHPFHIHTNSMQVTSVTGANPLIPLPYVADTVWIPPGGTIVFQMLYKQWRGKTVFHCHKLPHEDQGMMANVMYV